MILSLLVIPIGTRSANMPLRQFKNITMLLIYCSMHSFIHSFIQSYFTYRMRKRKGSGYPHWSVHWRYRQQLGLLKILRRRMRGQPSQRYPSIGINRCSMLLLLLLWLLQLMVLSALVMMVVCRWRGVAREPIALCTRRSRSSHVAATHGIVISCIRSA